MTLDLAFWAESYDEPTAVKEVKQQAREWAAAEPNVTGCRILKVLRHPDRVLWYTVKVRLTLRQALEQQSLELVA